jgi:membrane protein implicated in regulation of membrane protease activity
LRNIGAPARTAIKYVLVQIPSALLLLVILLLLRHWFALSRWLIWTIFALWVAKDVALYPFLRRAYEPSDASAFGNLQGACGVARERLAPTGYIFIRGELWQAEVQGSETVEVGEEVVVRGRRGLVLLVAPDGNGGQPPARG